MKYILGIELRGNSREFVGIHFMNICKDLELNHFNINDRDPTRLFLIAQGNTDIECNQKLHDKFKKIQLFFKVFYPEIQIRKAFSPLYIDENSSVGLNRFEPENMADLSSSLEKYMSRKFVAQEDLLDIALENIRSGSIFDGFSKLVNWLDENKSKGCSMFCSVRDVLSHGETDNAIKKVQEQFPNQFVFNDGVFDQTNVDNRKKIQEYLPELMKQVKRVFKEKYATIVYLENDPCEKCDGVLKLDPTIEREGDIKSSTTLQKFICGKNPEHIFTHTIMSFNETISSNG